MWDLARRMNRIAEGSLVNNVASQMGMQLLPQEAILHFQRERAWLLSTLKFKIKEKAQRGFFAKSKRLYSTVHIYMQ